MTKSGMIFNIQRFCSQDGPGIRTTVFLKGCPLRCSWCHNPESQKASPELMYNSSLCIGCGTCDAVCPQEAHTTNDKHNFSRKLCTSCGKCSTTCPTMALEMAGYIKTVPEIIKTVSLDSELYKKTSGGLTLSGGEPLFQVDFSYELLKSAKGIGIHTCVETCGYAKHEDLMHIASVTDLFLYDWKITNPSLHKKYTGAKNDLIKENLLALDNSGANIILRCPIIPNINDNDEHFFGIASLANELKNLIAIDIEPYHPLGQHKKKMLVDNTYDPLFPTPTREDIENCIKKISQNTDVSVRKV